MPKCKRIHSTINSLMYIIISLFLLVSPALSAGPVAKPGCPDKCGDLPIPYPFGVGSGCFLQPSFDINCTDHPPKAYLSIINKELIEINQNYIRVKYPNLISACYDLSTNQRIIINDGSDTHSMSMSVNLSGTPYTLSSVNRITAIGCDDMVLVQSNGTFLDGGCSAFCADNTGTVGFCPSDGCCQAEISADGLDISFLEAQLIDLSRKSQRKKLFPCSYAFIQEKTELNDTNIFSYPLYYLTNSTALINDNWASATRPPVVQLGWKVGAESCRKAELNSTTYACRDNKSVCFDEYYGARRGYTCSCVQGYQGNPYLPGGCQRITFSSSIARPGCPDQCGKLSIPFPFGVGPSCFLAPSFEIICNTTTNPPTAYLPLLGTEIIDLNSSRVLVNYPNRPGYVCYNFSRSGDRFTTTESRSLSVDLLRSQYSLSDENWITTVGCADMVVAVIGEDSRSSSIRSSCAAVCSNNREIYLDSGADCPYSTNMYSPGHGCCRAPIPKGTNRMEANLTDLGEEWRRNNISCSYSFVEYNENNANSNNPDQSSYAYVSSSFLVNSTEITSDKFAPTIRLALDWRIGAVNCKEARRDRANFACQANTDCIDFDGSTVGLGGYLCNCSRGYQGNPYLAPGCQDIDECADITTNACNSNSTCINIPGSYQCSCPKGYIGDGRKDGTSCIQLPPSKSKMIIFTGIGSGLGFLLLLAMLFKLSKMLKKRKEKMAKEKFFKRNGGLLLRQQTNEGALGKTKVFPAKELEVATDYFNESRILGQGGQGTVYKGMLSDGKIVAVKRSKLVEEDQLEQFINEVVIMSQINHRNVVRLLGCCLETEVPLLVYEFMPNGTLFELIHDPNSEFPVPWNMRLKIMADIAGALAYLHSASSMPIYHRDIKSSNILLDEKYVVKVSDFGTSRSITTDQTHLTTLVKGTIGYLDPEYFQSSQFTEKSDVYSFGVVVIELLTGKRPISHDNTDEERGLATRFLRCMEENCLDTIIDRRISKEGKKEEVILVARLAQRCLNFKGKMRPTMKEVANELESYRMSELSTCVEDEDEVEEGVRDFEDIPLMISDTEYTWTYSPKSALTSPSDKHPLILGT